MISGNIIQYLQHITHYSLHFLAPALLAWIFFRDMWVKAWLLMLATMLVDLDHLLADPVFDPERCGIGFHPLHSYYAIAVYFLMLVIPNRTVRIISVGLLFHMLSDILDCIWM